MHEEIPGPPAPSVQLKLEARAWLTTYVPPLAGAAMAAAGADVSATAGAAPIRQEARAATSAQP